MIKKYSLVIVAGIAMVLSGYFVATTLGQLGRNGREVELLPPTTLVSAAANVITIGLTAPRPRGVDVKVNKRLLGVVQVNTAPSSGWLEVYFQSSPDCGMSWQDFTHVHVVAAGTYYVPLSLGPHASWPTTVPTTQDGTLGSGLINQWGICERVRAKYNARFDSLATGTWGFHVYVIPD